MQLKNEIRRRRAAFLSFLPGALVCLSIAIPALSQVRINSKPVDKKTTELRAVGVLEWVGEEGKPSASRLVPIAVFSGERYQDAGVYMARPEPMAVERDTEYELQQAGTPKGRFDIFSAGNVEGFWYGYGVWKPMMEYHPPKLAVSKVLPQIQSDSDADRPHFKKGDAPDTASGSGTQSSTNTAGSSQPAPNPGNGPHISSSSDDPDRPKLRKRQTTETTANTNADAPGASAEADDPDRPKLHRGKPDSVSPEQKLTGTPPRLQQMVALSTLSTEEPHSYVYQWANPEDATKMQSALEKIARQELAGKQSAVPASPAHKAPVHTAKPVKSQAPTALMVDDFRAFELSYSGGATLVFSCRTLDEGSAAKFVTIIAQPDFYGAPRIIFKQVTDGGHLDETPRMKLVDAVDTNGDHRAELIFELHGKTDRQFGIYQVGSARAEQVFLTSSLP